MKKYNTQFERIKIGKNFSKNGNLYKKRSTRTAEIVSPTEYAGQWFYFSNKDQVIITDLSSYL